MEIVIIEQPKKERIGMPYTRVEQNLVRLDSITGGCFKEPVDADEMAEDFWFYEKGKGFFIGDSSIFKDRAVCLDEECGRGIDAMLNEPAFQEEEDIL